MRYSKIKQPQDSGKWRKSHPTTQNAYFGISKWGLPKPEAIPAW
jgi:hypothetical protein